MYQALYRKWRPQSFDEVVGQKHITDTLRNQIKNNRLSHAYLFIGTRGTGKTTCARILAKAVNCHAPVEGNPCGKCPACLGISDGTVLDHVYILAEGITYNAEIAWLDQQSPIRNLVVGAAVPEPTTATLSLLALAALAARRRRK